MKKLLFIGEATTLAHVARPISIAQSLDASRFQVEVACSRRYAEHVHNAGLPWREIDSISPERFLNALKKGSPLYDVDTLSKYVEQDLQVLDVAKPDVVIGDFRLSLSVSARLARIPYVALSNAYWSPYFRTAFPVPTLPISRWLPIPLAQALFSAARSLAFAMHCMPLNSVRRKHGLPSLGGDLRRVYTDADQVWYADSPQMYKQLNLPPCHHFIGPVGWAPRIPLPDWWERVPSRSGTAYITMGSSGDRSVLPTILRAIKEYGLNAMVASFGAPGIHTDLRSNIYVSDMLPGDQAAAKADLVICNGGSPTTHQSLLEGTRVLGVCGNLDQYLNMSVITAYGAGRCVRSDRLEVKSLGRAIQGLMRDDRATEVVKRVREEFLGLNVSRAERLANLLSFVP